MRRPPRCGRPALPHLGPSLLRLLDELTGVSDGLSRSERQALGAVASGARTPVAAFRACRAMEEAAWMGDASFFGVVEGLTCGRLAPLASRSPPPAVPGDGIPPAAWFGAAQLAPTESGRQILAGRLDHVAANGIDRWLGGTHLAPGAVRRWDAERRLRVWPA